MAARKKQSEASRVGLDASATIDQPPPRDIAALGERVRADGGAVLATYREPFGSNWLLLAALPIEMLEPTPYQRELSPTHAKRLATVIGKIGEFLDPVVAVRHDGRYWTPNGMHRLAAMRTLGARAMTALVVPDEAIALRILALNTEKAHNLKDKSLEVARMARAMASSPEGKKRDEIAWAFEFEEPAYLTLGLCYEARPRFSGAVYLPVLKRIDAFAEEPLRVSLEKREKRRDALLELDDAVGALVDALRAAGMKSPYLRPYVVARVNPLRFAKAPRPGTKAPRGEFDATIAKMLASAQKLDVSKVRLQDLASMGGAPPADDEG